MPGHPEPDARSQHDKFVEIARELGADEDEAAFKEKLAVIARQKPKDAPANPVRGKRGDKR